MRWVWTLPAGVTGAVGTADCADGAADADGAEVADDAEAADGADGADDATGAANTPGAASSAGSARMCTSMAEGGGRCEVGKRSPGERQCRYAVQHKRSRQRPPLYRLCEPESPTACICVAVWPASSANSSHSGQGVQGSAPTEDSAGATGSRRAPQSTSCGTAASVRASGVASSPSRPVLADIDLPGAAAARERRAADGWRGAVRRAAVRSARTVCCAQIAPASRRPRAGFVLA